MGCVGARGFMVCAYARRARERGACACKCLPGERVRGKCVRVRVCVESSGGGRRGFGWQQMVKSLSLFLCVCEQQGGRGKPTSVVVEAVDDRVCQVVDLAAAEASQADPAITRHVHRVLVGHVVHLHKTQAVTVIMAKRIFRLQTRHSTTGLHLRIHLGNAWPGKIILSIQSTPCSKDEMVRRPRTSPQPSSCTAKPPIKAWGEVSTAPSWSLYARPGGSVGPTCSGVRGVMVNMPI